MLPATSIRPLQRTADKVGATQRAHGTSPSLQAWQARGFTQQRAAERLRIFSRQVQTDRRLRPPASQRQVAQGLSRVSNRAAHGLTSRIANHGRRDTGADTDPVTTVTWSDASSSRAYRERSLSRRLIRPSHAARMSPHVRSRATSPVSRLSERCPGPSVATPPACSKTIVTGQALRRRQVRKTGSSYFRWGLVSPPPLSSMRSR